MQYSVAKTVSLMLKTKINKFYFAKSNTDKDGIMQATNPSGAYEIESLNNEIRRIFINEGHFQEVDFSFKIKPSFSTKGSMIKTSRQEPLIIFFLMIG